PSARPPPLILFSPHRHHRHLPSFPTRRSSDLEGHRALVFSQFTSYLRAVAAELDAQGIAYEYLDGSTRDRTKDIESFRTGSAARSEEHTSELQSRFDLVCRLLLEKKKRYTTSS